MSPEKQRIVIAKACGWKNIRLEDNTERIVLKVLVGDYYLNDVAFEIPDYLNDLNAMHEAEKVLTDGQWEEYLRRHTAFDWRLVNSTAAQRAEAFLKTLDKWEN